MIGRIGSIIFIIISMLWIPVVIGSNTPIFLYVVGISATFQMPLSAIFFMGHFWNRANSIGAGTCLIIGLGFGFVRFISTYALTEEQCDEFILCSMNVLFFGMAAFLLSVILIIIGSLISKAPQRIKVDGNTYWNKWDEMHVAPTSSSLAGDMIKEDSVDEEHDETENTEETKKGRTGSSLNPLLIESGNDENGKMKKDETVNILLKMWKLSGDTRNKKWMIGLHVMTFCSVVLTISMWIYFW